MMRLVVLTSVFLIGCGGGKEQRACEHGMKLCEAGESVSSCTKKVGELREPLGDVYDRSLDCAIEAQSCPEFAGCFVGGLGAAVEDMTGKFGRGVEKMIGGKDHDVEGRSGGERTAERHAASRDGNAELLEGCRKFSGSARAARWEGCSDRVRRELRCKPFIDELSCDCLEDGVKTWSFMAHDPPLDDRADASRVAAANCRRGFGN